MHNRGFTGKLRYRSAVAVLFAVAGSLLVSAGFGSLWLPPASAQAVGARVARAIPSPSKTDNEPASVSADSGSDAWAVGYYGVDTRSTAPRAVPLYQHIRPG
jgi:hypothetical protein